MGDGYSAEELDGITIVRFDRYLGVDEVIEIMARIAETYQNNRRLWSVTEHFNFAPDEIARITDHARQLWGPGSKVAFAAADDLSFGLLRVLEVYREQENFSTQVFRSEPEALEWLKKPFES